LTVTAIMTSMPAVPTLTALAIMTSMPAVPTLTALSPIVFAVVTVRHALADVGHERH
jgi:hypothetical protein